MVGRKQHKEGVSHGNALLGESREKSDFSFGYWRETVPFVFVFSSLTKHLCIMFMMKGVEYFGSTLSICNPFWLGCYRTALVGYGKRQVCSLAGTYADAPQGIFGGGWFMFVYESLITLRVFEDDGCCNVLDGHEGAKNKIRFPCIVELVS